MTFLKRNFFRKPLKLVTTLIHHKTKQSIIAEFSQCEIDLISCFVCNHIRKTQAAWNLVILTYRLLKKNPSISIHYSVARGVCVGHYCLAGEMDQHFQFTQYAYWMNGKLTSAPIWVTAAPWNRTAVKLNFQPGHTKYVYAPPFTKSHSSTSSHRHLHGNAKAKMLAQIRIPFRKIHTIKDRIQQVFG